MADNVSAACYLDHLVVAAAGLEQGADYLRRLLGVELSAGGKHEAQGTHNRLLRLGESTYFELIAIDPQAGTPARPRWFGLDSPALRERIAQRPRLITWVARTDSLVETIAAAGFDFGAIRPMQRGDYRWQITCTADGALLHDGVMPTLIQWQGEQHPARTLPDSGCGLLRLEGFTGGAESVVQVLRRVGLADAIHIGAPQSGDQSPLRAQIATPAGIRIID